MKVLYGGSFNPPTRAHLKIAEKIYEKFDVEEFVFLPTANNYQKPNLAPICDRITMLTFICKHLKNASVSDFEAKISEYKGTSYTLECFPGFYFVMGADNFDYIEKWINYPEVIIKNKFIIVPRDKYDFEKKFKSEYYLNKYRDNFIILDIEDIDMSASLFRINNDRDLVIDEVYDYIKEHSLYK